MTEENIFDVLDEILGVKIPEILANILKKSGFDCRSTLALISLENIAEIEEFTNENREVLVESIYENMIPFKFLPAHRIFIRNLSNYVDQLKSHESNVEQKMNLSQFPYLLKCFIETAQSHANKSVKAFRYTEHIQSFATYVYMMCGKACYESLSANMPIPKASTVLAYIKQKKQRIIEGELRFKQLNEYLERLQLKKCVWLSEDATGIVLKLEYDPSTNQIVGLVLPLDSKTGIPISFSFMAESVAEIQKFVKKRASTHLYLVLAQPLMAKVPPFVLQVFGSDNTFTAVDVQRRWKHTIVELQKYGISVAGISADGDPRLINCMLYNSPIETHLNSKEDWESFDILENLYFVQDTIHAALKLRNRILMAGIVLPFGNRLVSVAHLKMLINDVPKDEHSLVLKDICSDDKQNYRALEKIMHPNVSSALTKYVINSEATVMYIKICSDVASSFREIKLPPLERIHKIFHAAFLLRIWKKWIERSNGTFNVRKNFITENAYQCVEINAHNLVSVMKMFRDKHLEELFIPSLMRSQPCEETFRTLRSMGTINYTKINFTLLEVMHMISRVELLNNIVYFKLANSQISLPRNQMNNASPNSFKLPSDSEIEETIVEAKKEAIANAMKFGMETYDCDIDMALINRPDIFNPTCPRKRKHVNDLDSESDGETEIPILSAYSTTKLYPHEHSEVESSPFIRICDDNGIDKSMRKSTLIWFLTDSTKKLSNDRLTRVQGTPKKKSCARRLNFSVQKHSDMFIIENNEIKIGQWCIFNREEQNGTNMANRLVLGNVLAFQYIKGKTHREKKYTWDYVPITFEENDDRKARGIEVLAAWFNIDSNGNVLKTESNQSFYLNIDYYKATLSNPPIINEQLSLLKFKADLSKYL